jgi:DNA-binding PadR family transcriptional regulator
MFGWKDGHHGRGRDHGPCRNDEREERHGVGRGGPRWGRHRGSGRGGFERGYGGRMFGPGDLRLVLMALIEEKPRHGYDLIKAIEEAFGGAYAPSPGAVYPTLALLEDEGLLTVAQEGGKRIYTLTDAGKAWLNDNRAAVVGVMERMRMAARAMSGQATPDTVHETLRTLKQAVQMKPGDWSLEEEARVVEILMNAAREISRQQ